MAIEHINTWYESENKNKSLQPNNTESKLAKLLESNKIPEYDKNSLNKELASLEEEKNNEINKTLSIIKQELNSLKAEIPSGNENVENKEKLDYSNPDHIKKATQQALLKVLERENNQNMA